MINGMEFARQQSKKLLEDFIKSLQPYTDVFIKSNGKAVLRNWRKITWHFQKDQSGKLERDLNRNLEALRIYTDALFQYTAGWQFRDILSGVTDLRKEVAHMSSTIQAVNRAHSPARQLSSIENEHQHRSVTLFQHSKEARIIEPVSPLEFRELDIRELPPLHRAAARGSLREISAHLDRGQNINERLLAEVWLNPIWGKFNFTGCSPLHLASWFGHIKAMELLLDGGANIASEDKDRAQALQYAIYSGNAGGAGLLISRGASLASQDIWGKRALHDACITGPLWLIRFILERGADIFAKDNGGMTAFHKAAIRGDSAILKLLVDAGAGPDVHDG
jgi:ankyrin repeat protein